MKKELAKIKGEFLDKTTALITAAFGLVMALAWNELVKTIFKSVFGERTTVSAMAWYAVTVTLIGVTLTIWVGRTVARIRGSKET